MGLGWPATAGRTSEKKAATMMIMSDVMFHLRIEGLLHDFGSRSLLRTVPVSHHFDLSFFFTFNPLSSGRLGGSHRLARLLPIEMNAHELSCTPVIRVLHGPIGVLGLRKLDERGNQDCPCVTPSGGAFVEQALDGIVFDADFALVFLVEKFDGFLLIVEGKCPGDSGRRFPARSRRHFVVLGGVEVVGRRCWE